MLVGAALFGFLSCCSTTTRAATLLVLNSDPGDYVGQGKQYAFGATDGHFSAQAIPNGIMVTVAGTVSPENWTILAGAAPGQPFTIATYLNATEFKGPNVGSHPFLDVTGDGRGCGPLSGQFGVRDLAYAPNSSVTKLAIDFEQHCENQPPALFGSLRINSDVPLPISPTPSPTPDPAQNFLALHSSIDEYLGGGLSRFVTPASGAFRVTHGFGAVSILFTGIGGLPLYRLNFVSPPGQDLIPATYAYTDFSPNVGGGRFGLSLDGSGCPAIGEFTIVEAMYESDGTVERLAADFEHHCYGQAPVLAGSLRINSSAPTSTPLPTWTLTPSATPTNSQTPTNTSTATDTPTATPSVTGSATPTIAQTCTPTVHDTFATTQVPTQSPMDRPTEDTTAPPTSSPNFSPTGTVTATPSVTATWTVAICVGDCDANRSVTVDELVVGVNIAIGKLAPDFCPAFDCNDDKRVTVDCLVKAVKASLDGCPSEFLVPTATPMMTLVSAPTRTADVPVGRQLH
ncbi:MAG TPA: hypothetical protein VMW17_24780 [Candidatus Binatia bacterium]|nr:hypothetical protein [Candidatus Binatia bacterium]